MGESLSPQRQSALYSGDQRRELGGADVFYAVGENATIGYSPFAIDSFNAEQATDLGANYSAIASVAPILLEQQSKGNVHGFSLTREHPSVEYSMNDYTVRVSLDEIFGNHSEKGFGLIIATGQDEFLGVGKGFRVLITTRAPGLFKLGYASYL